MIFDLASIIDLAKQAVPLASAGYKGSVSHLIQALSHYLDLGDSSNSLEFATYLADFGRAKSNFEVSLFYSFLSDYIFVKLFIFQGVRAAVTVLV